MSKTTDSLIEVPKTSDNPQLEYAIRELFDPKNLSMKTDLPTMRLLNALARGEIYAKQFHSDLMQNLVDDIMTKLISYKRKGRIEIKEITQQLQSSDKAKDGLMSKLMG